MIVRVHPSVVMLALNPCPFFVSAGQAGAGGDSQGVQAVNTRHAILRRSNRAESEEGLSHRLSRGTTLATYRIFCNFVQAATNKITLLYSKGPF